MVNRNRIGVAFFLLCVFIGVAGCTSDSNGTTSGKINEPVELTAYYMYSGWDTKRFMDDYGNHIQKKYPHFSFKFIGNEGENSFDSLVVQGTKVDIFLLAPSSYGTLADAGYGSDISDLIKKYKFNVKELEESALKAIEDVNGGVLSGLPVFLNYAGMFYNTDIFEKFAQKVPTNDMTWDEIFEMAKRMTVMDGGVQYVGLGFQPLDTLWMNNQYSQELIDPKSGKVLLDSGKWPDMLRNAARFFEISGSDYVPAGKVYEMFLSERRLAMMVSGTGLARKDFIPEDFHFGLITMPSFADQKGVGASPDPFIATVSGNSINRDAAFLAIAEVLSPEAQAAFARENQFPARKIDNLDKILGANVAALQGKDMQGLIPRKFALPIRKNERVMAIASHLSQAAEAVMRGEKDVNTALREAKELAERTIAELEVSK